MDEPAEKPPFAWQPLTARGVAAFSRASFGRLWGVQLVFGLLAAATVVLALAQCWFPVIRQAIRQLPGHGEIRTAHLTWSGTSPQKLAENRFLSLAVDLPHEGLIRTPAHVQVELGSGDLKVISLFGTLKVDYPRGWIISLDRQEAEPWFGAWAPAILGITAGLVIAGLLASWALLSTVYFLPSWLLAFFANRNLRLGGAWRMCGAALLPGCLLLTTTLFFYELSVLDLVHLLVGAGLHFVVGWVYVFVAILALPRHPAMVDARANPFKPEAKPTVPPTGNPS